MLIFAACLAIFVYGMVASMLGTIIPGLASQFNLTNVQIGYVALSQGVGLASASLAVGALMDKRGKKAGLLLGLGLILAGLLQLAHPFGVHTIMGGIFIVGMGGSMVIVGANALGSDVSEVRRASVLNFLNVFVGLGGLATPFVAGNLLGSNPTRVAVAACVITAATFIVIAMTRIEFKPIAREDSAVATAAVFQNLSLYVLAAVIFLYTACEFGLWNWLPKYLIARGLPSSSALNILSLGFALGLLCGRIGATQVLTRISPLTVSVSASVVMTVTTYLMLHTSSPTLTAIIVFCAGLSMAPVFPTVLSIVGDIFTRATSTAMGFVITCGFSGLVVSSPIIGWLSGPDPKGLGVGLLLLPTFSICIFLLLVSFRARLSAKPSDAAVAQMAL
jgi:fucose permease